MAIAFFTIRIFKFVWEILGVYSCTLEYGGMYA
jgi:hypothetical protein